MEYLTQQNRRNEGDAVPAAETITARDKRVVIIGGGDTGADCLGTVHRQGARSVAQFELLPPPAGPGGIRTIRGPTWPNVFRVSAAHEEGGDRVYSVSTERFSGTPDGRVARLHGAKVEMSRKNGRPSFERVAGSGVRHAGRPGAARDGISRAGAAGPADGARRQADRARQRVAGRELE